MSTPNNGTYNSQASSVSSNGQRKMSKRRSCASVISPEENKFLKKWDLVTVIALLFVCFVSPFEIAFLVEQKTMSESLKDPLFFTNRFVDCVFIFDMCLQFFCHVSCVNFVWNSVNW